MPTVKVATKKYAFEITLHEDKQETWVDLRMAMEQAKIALIQQFSKMQHEPDHVCGLQGFNQMLGDTCEACEKRRIEWELRPKPRFGPIVPHKH